MDWFAKMFIRASLIWFVLGITLGLANSLDGLHVVPGFTLPVSELFE